jgi:hypothetical protein
MGHGTIARLTTRRFLQADVVVGVNPLVSYHDPQFAIQAAEGPVDDAVKQNRGERIPLFNPAIDLDVNLAQVSLCTGVERLEIADEAIIYVRAFHKYHTIS